MLIALFKQKKSGNECKCRCPWKNLVPFWDFFAIYLKILSHELVKYFEDSKKAFVRYFMKIHLPKTSRKGNSFLVTWSYIFFATRCTWLLCKFVEELFLRFSFYFNLLSFLNCIMRRSIFMLLNKPFVFLIFVNEMFVLLSKQQQKNLIFQLL